MKKSLKMVATTLLFTGAFAPFAPMTEVAAQAQGGQLRLVKNWIQRSHHEVVQSITEDLAVSNTYTIRWGDTLATIAQAMGMTVEEVARLNNITNTDLIIAGNVLYFDGSNLQVVEEDVVEETEVAEETEAEATETEVPTTIYTTEETTEAYVETTEETTEAYVETTEETTEAYVETTEETTEAYVETTEETTEAYVETTEETTAEVIETTEEVTQAPTPTTNLTAREAFNVLAAEKGLTQSEIDGWAYIIERESGWNHTISNPYSGAYGLPQALPGNKMASHGADWQTNPYTQLSWMYDYMVNRYGSIQGALNFWHANHWY